MNRMERGSFDDISFGAKSIASIKANEGKEFNYPFSLNLIK